MAEDKLILATSSNGKDITVEDCDKYLKAKDKAKLSAFIYDRFYGRYLKPFDFLSNDYITKYKNGFALMASCCLLIETYVSFKSKKHRNTKNISGECFEYFFTTEKKFSEFAIVGIPKEFYENVRCAILHNAETRGGWTITRKLIKPYFDLKTKTINATKFANRLEAVLNDYKRNLMVADFDNDDIWVNFKNRLNDLKCNSSVINKLVKNISTRYEIIIYWSKEDEAFIAEVPELSGCMADGKTYKKALANVEVVIKEWIETAKMLNRPIPEPKGKLIYA